MPTSDRPADERTDRRVHPIVDVLAAYSWRLIGIGIVGWVVVALLGRVRVVVFPVIVATFITVALTPPARWLRERGWRPLLATWAVFAGFLGTLALVGVLVVPAMSQEFGDLGPTLTDAYDDARTWLVDDSPFDVDRARLDELEEQGRATLRRSVSSSAGLIVSGAVLVLETVAGLLLALVLTFFFVKDGPTFQRFALDHLPADRRELAARVAGRAWWTLGGYLRGAAMLGAVESVAIGLALALAGGALVVPVMALTFASAFVPFVGAIVAGLVAVAVALSTGGVSTAAVVAIVAVVVQQLDNDLLAPIVYGRALRLHPVVILLAVGCGGALGGLGGAVLAVPITAVVVNAISEARQADGEATVETAS